MHSLSLYSVNQTMFIICVDANLYYIQITCESMILKNILILIAVLTIAQTQVIDLDDSNFTSFIEQHPYVFVEFYAPWCGHCKSLAPEYEKLGELAKGKDYVIAKVDATVAEKTASAFGVEGFPTINFIANGFPIQYKGERNAAGMQQWLEQFFASKIVALTEAELKLKVGSEDFLLVQGASKEQLQVLEIANFVDQSVAYYQTEGDYKITLYLAKDSQTLEYSGELNADDLTKWTASSSMPSVVPLNSEQQTKLVFENEEKVGALLLYRLSDFSEESFEVLKKTCEASKSFKCAYVDNGSTMFKGVARYLRAQGQTESLLAYVKYGLKEAYKFTAISDISQENLKQFIEDANEGKLQKYIDIEKEKKEKEIKYSHVLKLTAETYNSTLADNEIVFVEYYSPSCGHCVRFAPEYDQLALKVKEEGLNIVIAAVDLVTEKAVGEWVDVNGYPTLRLYINGNEVEYNGARSGDDILQFIKKAQTTTLTTLASTEQIPNPSVVIRGVTKDSPFQLLPLLYTRFPIYWVEGESFEVSVQYGKHSGTYQGEAILKDVATWLDEATEPLIVSVVDSKPAKKLTRALEGKAPLLVVAKRDEVANYVLEVLEEYCLGKIEQVVCGYADKADQDYESFNNWLGDSTPQKSLLLVIDTKQFKKLIFEGELSTLTVAQVDEFVVSSLNQLTAGKGETQTQQQQTEQAVQQAPQTQQKVQPNEEL